MSGYPTFTRIPRVDGLSTDPQVLGRHNLVFASAKDLLTKNVGLWLLSSQPFNKVALTTTSKTAKYMKSVSPASGLATVQGVPPDRD